MLAFKALKHEIDVVQLICMQRSFKQVLARLFTDEECAKIKQASNFVNIDPDEGKIKPINDVPVYSKSNSIKPETTKNVDEVGFDEAINQAALPTTVIM